MIHKLDVQNHVMNTTRMIFSYDVQLLKNMTEKWTGSTKQGRGKKREKKETSAPETSTKKGQFEGY